jgi:ATP-dependent DNA helicase RecQ
LDPGLLLLDPETGELGGGNVVAMTEGWRRIWEFLAQAGILAPERSAHLTTDESLRRQTLTPEIREVLSLALRTEEESALRASGELRDEVLERSRRIGGLLRDGTEEFALKEKQVEAIAAVADGHDVLAVLPTGYGKSYAFQLPALALPGVTIVVSPLISLMHHQALELNRTIGGAVRALVAPLTVSNSRLGKADIQDALMGRDDHGIRIVYLSPERLCTRQFQELIESGVEKGIVRRIAIDEAHTAIQWGDDFRPSYRRTLRFVRDLRVRHPNLAVTALTATANPTVLEGLRENVFGLSPQPSAAEPGFVYVAANPIRPELAIYRRTLAKREGGPLTVAGLVEEVLGALDGHAIFYCLTVKEVNALWAQLRDVLGPEGAPRVRRYHARLSEAEKTAVMSDFVTAPRRGDDDFSPMVVVATSAFGLGIDREDIRCVFVVSPPTDLAALYQQLGRAGRDRSVQRVDPDGPANVGLALGTPAGFGLVRWMTRQGDLSALLTRMATTLLALGATPRADEYVSVDVDVLARQHLDADHDAGLLNDTQHRSARMDETYRTGIARVVAALADLGAVEDLGDFPSHVKLGPGVTRATGPIADVVKEIENYVGTSKRTEIASLHHYLTANLPDYVNIANEPGATWSLLVDLYALGHLDVSQGVTRSTLTGLVLAAGSQSPRVAPAGLSDHLRRRTDRATRECTEMERWYSATDCVNAGFARYFQVDELPEDVCQHGVSRCSSCWGDRAVAEAGEPLPPLLSALRRAKPRPASATAAGRPLAERTLDAHVDALLWENRRGLSANIITKVLHGDDSYFDRRSGKIRKLWPPLYETRHRGSSPGASLAHVEASLNRLSERGVAVRAGAFWRLTRYVDEEARRAAREGTPVVAGGGQ